MGRYGRRVSRSLIGALVAVVILGLFFYLKNLNKTQAEVTTPAPAETSAAKLAIAPQAVTPATQPKQIAMALPATQPVQNTPTPAPAPTPTPAADVSNPIPRAQAKLSSNDKLGARTILNDALLAGSLSPADQTTVKKMLSDINQEVIFSPKHFADDPFGGTYSVQSGDVLKKIADKYEVTWEALLRLNGMSDARKLRAGQTLKVIHGPFNAVVTKGAFTLDIYLGPPMEKGSMYVTTYSVGLGKDNSTPTGSWLVEAGKKLKNPTYYSSRGEGVIAADDPKNPLGERWVGLTGIDGHALGAMSYGIHGTIDESSIGKMDSQGCIRMHNADVEWVFDLMVEGKSIVVVRD